MHFHEVHQKDGARIQHRRICPKDELEVPAGQIAPGVPRSTMQGGLWYGVEVVSKSGAFGPPTLWRDLLIDNGLMCERIE